MIEVDIRNFKRRLDSLTMVTEDTRQKVFEGILKWSEESEKRCGLDVHCPYAFGIRDGTLSLEWGADEGRYGPNYWSCVLDFRTNGSIGIFQCEDYRNDDSDEYETDNASEEDIVNLLVWVSQHTVSKG